MQDNITNKHSQRMSILPILFGFFVMGFVDVVGIATNYVKQDFQLSDTIANLLPMMVFLWFAVFSIPTGLLMNRIGRKHTVALSLILTGGAMLLPLIHYDFPLLLIAFALLGIGNTILQVSLNPMVASVVSPQHTASVLTLGQFLKAISSFLGPILAGLAASLWGNWKWTFLIYALTSLLSLLWLLTIKEAKRERTQETSFKTVCHLFQDRYILGLFLGILFIVGIDVGLNTSIPKLLMERLDMPLSEAGLGASIYFAARTTGTFIGTFVLVKCSARHFLSLSMIVSIAALGVLLCSASFSVMALMIVIIGLACSNVFSILFSFALQHKPEQDNEISALMIMGVSGGALITPLMGVLADAFGQVGSFILLLLCMLYLGWTALYVIRNTSKQ